MICWCAGVAGKAHVTCWRAGVAGKPYVTCWRAGVAGKAHVACWRAGMAGKAHVTWWSNIFKPMGLRREAISNNTRWSEHISGRSYWSKKVTAVLKLCLFYAYSLTFYSSL